MIEPKWSQVMFFHAAYYIYTSGLILKRMNYISQLWLADCTWWMGTKKYTQNGYHGFYSNQAVMGIISVMRVCIYALMPTTRSINCLLKLVDTMEMLHTSMVGVSCGRLYHAQTVKFIYGWCQSSLHGRVTLSHLTFSHLTYFCHSNKNLLPSK